MSRQYLHRLRSRGELGAVDLPPREPASHDRSSINLLLPRIHVLPCSDILPAQILVPRYGRIGSGRANRTSRPVSSAQGAHIPLPVSGDFWRVPVTREISVKMEIFPKMWKKEMFSRGKSRTLPNLPCLEKRSVKNLRKNLPCFGKICHAWRKNLSKIWKKIAMAREKMWAYPNIHHKGPVRLLGCTCLSHPSPKRGRRCSTSATSILQTFALMCVGPAS